MTQTQLPKGSLAEADLPRIVEMAAPDYHALTGFASKSMLFDFRRSPRDFQATYILGTRKRKKASPQMKVGDLVHHALLEPDGFADSVAMIPPETLAKNGSTNTNAYREWAAKLNPGQVPLKLTQFAAAKGMIDSLATKFADVFNNVSTRREASIFWIDQATGVLCRCRPDLLLIEHVPNGKDGTTRVRAFDVKGSFDPLPAVFASTSKRFGYWFQAAHYLSGLRQLIGPGPSITWEFLAVQDEPPFKSRAFSFDDETLDYALSERQQTLEDYRHALETGNWADPGENETTTLHHSKEELANYVWTE